MRRKPSPTFTAYDVTRALEVPSGTLNSWAFRGLFKDLDAAKTAPGKARRFTLADLFRLAIMKRLLELGVAADQARGWATMCVRNMDETPISEMHVLIYKDSLMVHLGDVMDEPLPPDALLRLTIYPRAIVQDLKEKLGVQEPRRAA